jgi:lysophospholipase L1-like esterase
MRMNTVTLLNQGLFYRSLRYTTRLLIALLVLLLGLGWSLTMTTADRADAAGAPVRVIPLGDSITDGYNVPGGYRIKLWQDLVANQYEVDLVGSQSNGPASLGDKNHEGRSGWRIEQIHSNVEGWLSQHQPQLVLLLIGTNDMLQNYQVAQAPQRLSALIDTIVSEAPQSRIILGTIPPASHAATNDRIVQYNSALRGIVVEKATQGVAITLVDMYEAMTVGDLADGVHPNLIGYNKLADRWYAEVVKYLPPAEPPSGLSHMIRGRVTTSDNIGLASVTISDGVRSVSTDADGWYMLTGVPVGSYTLRPALTNYGFIPATRRVMVDKAITGQDFVATVETHATVESFVYLPAVIR